MARCLEALAVVPLAMLASCGGGGGGSGIPAVDEPPTVVVLGPTVDVESPQDAPGVVVIDYADDDPDSVATTDLVADRDGILATTGDQIGIATGRPEQGGAVQSVPWDLAGVAPGTYAIFAITSDAQTLVTAQAAALVVVNAAPTLSLTTPSSSLTLSRGAPLAIQYNDNDPDDAALTWLFADRDGSLDTTPDTTLVASARPELDGAARNATWDTTGAEFGTYRIMGLTWDGSNAPAIRTASGLVTLRNAAFATGAGGTGNDYGNGIAALPDGGSVVVGAFEGSATFGPGEVNETVLVAAGGSDLFVAKYLKSGALEWAKQTGAGGNESAYAVASYPDGSFVVTGAFVGAVVFGSGDAAETTLTAVGASDLFLARYDVDGTLAWAKRAGGAGAGVGGLAVAAMADGGAVLTGHYVGAVTFGPGEGGQTTLAAAQSFDVFVARFSSTGTLTWAKKAAGQGTEEGYGIAAFPDGSCVVTGYFDDVLTFGSGEPGARTLTPYGVQEVFVARYNAGGTLAWATQEGGLNGVAAGIGAAAFPDGTCAVTGWFAEYMDFGFSEVNETNYLSYGGPDSFVARFSSGGQLTWAVRQGGGYNNDVGYAIAAQADGSCVVAGTFEYAAYFGQGDPNETLRFSTNATIDLYLARFDVNGQLVWVSQAGGTTAFVLPIGIAAFTDGSIGLAGYVPDGTAMFGAGGNLARPVTSAGVSDVFVARYNADGGF